MCCGYDINQLSFALNFQVNQETTFIQSTGQYTAEPFYLVYKKILNQNLLKPIFFYQQILNTFLNYYK